MIDTPFGEPLGPAGIAARMSEIQARLQSAFGPTPGSSGPKSFASALQGQMGGTLSGAIGPDGSAPLSPLGLTTRPDGTAPPELKQLINQAAARNGIDPDVLDSLVKQESGYSNSSHSRKGAMGLTQLMPDTAAELGVTNPFDPAQNIEGGAMYLKQQMNRFPNLATALAAYNAGPGKVIKAGGVPNIPETQSYVRNILSNVQQLKEMKNGQ